MNSQTHDGNKRMSVGRLRLAGAALVMATVGVQVANGAGSTMRVLGSHDEVKPVVDVAIANRESTSRRETVVQRESTLRVATATAAVLGRQESKVVEPQSSSMIAQPQDFTNAIRIAAAPREPAPEYSRTNESIAEKRAAALRSAPPTNISALTIAKPGAAPVTSGQSQTRPTPVATATTAVPIIRIQAPAAVKSQPEASAAAPLAAMAQPLPSAEITDSTSSRQSTPQVVSKTPAPLVSPTPSPVHHAPAAMAPAPSNVAQPSTPRTPAEPAPAASPAVRAPAPVGLAAVPIEQAPPSMVETPEIFDAPSVRIAQLPASIVPDPMTVGTSSLFSPEVSQAESIVAAPATYHPHSAPAPPNGGAGNDCVTDGAPEEYLLSDQPDCAYGPGQSGSQYVCGVDCGVYGAPCDAGWNSAHCIPWSLFGPGEYVGPSRSEHVSSYYLRVNDLLTLTYINSRQKLGDRYHLGIGDRLLIESSVDESLRREVEIQPDGEITLPIVGEVMAAGKTVKELREDLEEVFKESQREPQITVTPILINSAQQEIIRSVKAEIGSNGQALSLKVTPEGTIQVPGLGSVYVQGLTLDELRTELEARYAANFGAGLLISPALTQRAASFVFVVGEVKSPNRYTLEGPTTATQAIAMAGSWNVGANLHQVVVFRRDENWCLKAIKIDVRAPLYGTDPCPVNDVWLRDNDLVIVPKSKILCATDVINLYMTRGVYAAFPVSFFQDLSAGSTVIAP